MTRNEQLILDAIGAASLSRYNTDLLNENDVYRLRRELDARGVPIVPDVPDDMKDLPPRPTKP